MISGPPGIGKTTSVRIIAKALGFKTYELNASDQRNKSIINVNYNILILIITYRLKSDSLWITPL